MPDAMPGAMPGAYAGGIPTPDAERNATRRCTDGRTHGLTNALVQADVNLTAVDAGARSEIATIGQVLAGGLWVTDERHERVRAGEREPIPHHVRTAVYYRDRGRCELCGTGRVQGMWHLDHITPWSAGGSDRTDNLRVLCEKHNLERSNYVDPHERPRTPATWWCLNCFSAPWEVWYYADGSERQVCPLHGTSRRCSVLRGLEWAAENDQPDWHARHTIDTENASLVIAYCAHCGAPGLTDQPL